MWISESVKGKGCAFCVFWNKALEATASWTLAALMTLIMIPLGLPAAIIVAWWSWDERQDQVKEGAYVNTFEYHGEVCRNSAVSNFYTKTRWQCIVRALAKTGSMIKRWSMIWVRYWAYKSSISFWWKPCWLQVITLAGMGQVYEACVDLSVWLCGGSMVLFEALQFVPCLAHQGGGSKQDWSLFTVGAETWQQWEARFAVDVFWCFCNKLCEGVIQGQSNCSKDKPSDVSEECNRQARNVGCPATRDLIDFGVCMFWLWHIETTLWNWRCSEKRFSSDAVEGCRESWSNTWQRAMAEFGALVQRSI